MEISGRSYRPMPRQLPVAREGLPFFGIAVFASLALHLAGLPLFSLAFLGAAGFVLFFFRNPSRSAPSGSNLVLAPADGRVIRVQQDAVAPCTGKRCTKLSIFMSVMDVHVNRLPVSGRVKRAEYCPGRFFVASLDKASEHNERNALVIEDPAGRECVVVQIAGLVARRIVCYLREGDAALAGERYGLIRFGSRLDLYIPPEASVEVSEGDRTRAGETVVGRFE